MATRGNTLVLLMYMCTFVCAITHFSNLILLHNIYDRRHSFQFNGVRNTTHAENVFAKYYARKNEREREWQTQALYFPIYGFAYTHTVPVNMLETSWLVGERCSGNTKTMLPHEYSINVYLCQTLHKFKSNGKIILLILIWCISCGAFSDTGICYSPAIFHTLFRIPFHEWFSEIGTCYDLLDVQFEYFYRSLRISGIKAKNK